MAISKQSNSAAAAPVPLSPKVAGLLREAWWIALVGIALYITMILVTYDKGDPGWSHSETAEKVQNFGGHLGAWLADVLLYLFGASTYWWVVFLLYGIWWGYKRIDSPALSDRRSLFIASTGFIVLLFASSGLEALRFANLGLHLPLAAGGMIGAITSGPLSAALGFNGATLFLLMLMAIGFSLFTGTSWLTIMEKTGQGIETGFMRTREWLQKRQERRAAALAVGQRDEHVAEVKKRLGEPAPLRIEPATVEIPKSGRAEREKQVPLFQDIPGSPLPPLHLLDPAETDTEVITPETLEYTSRLIENKLLDFGVQVKVIAAYPGPVITRYEIEPATGVKGSQITNLIRDLARALSVVSIRVVETIPGKSCMGLEIPNPHRQTVRLTDILGSQAYASVASPLALAMGKDIGGKPVVADLGKMPHLLVAGTTGSGKSVGINAMILSLLYKSEPSKVRLILVDPKMLELSVYEGIPHLLAPVVTDMKQAAAALNWCVAEMERRYKLMSTMGVRNFAGCNLKIQESVKAGNPLTNPFSLTPDDPEPILELPNIVVVIDELADLMMVVGKKVEELIARLAQKARAAGIHLILATQRPSVDVITGLIKANIPTRVAFQVSSKIDSRTILDQMGAEALLGQGDMLYLPPGTGYPLRVHGAYVADHEVHKVVEYLKQQAEPQYIEGLLQEPDHDSDEMGETSGRGGESDPLYDEAVAIVLRTRRASISLVQRHLRIGYNRAARLIEEMEQAGLVSSMQSNGNREVLAPAGE